METFTATEYLHLIQLLCEGYAKAIGAEKMEKYRKQTTAFFKGNPETYPRVPCLPLHIQEVTGIDCKGSTFYQKYKAAQEGVEIKLNDDLHQAFCQYLGLTDLRAFASEKENSFTTNPYLNILAGYYAVYNLWLEKNVIHISYIEIDAQGNLSFASKYKRYAGTVQILADGRRMTWDYMLQETDRPQENRFTAFLEVENRFHTTFLKGVYAGYNSEGSIRTGRSFCKKIATLPPAGTPYFYEISAENFRDFIENEKEIYAFFIGKGKDAYLDNFYLLSPEYAENSLYAACYLSLSHAPENLIKEKLRAALRIPFYTAKALQRACEPDGALFAYRDWIADLLR